MCLKVKQFVRKVNQCVRKEKNVAESKTMCLKVKQSVRK